MLKAKKKTHSTGAASIGGQAQAGTKAAGRAGGGVFDPWISSVSAASAAIAELVKQTQELQRWTSLLGSRETDGISRPQPAPRNVEASPAPGAEKESIRPRDPFSSEKPAGAQAEAGTEVPSQKTAANSEDIKGDQPEKAVMDGGARMDDAREGAAEQPAAGAGPSTPPSGVVPEEKAETASLPEPPRRRNDLINRFDSALGRIRNPEQSGEEAEALLNQVVALLEAVSRHPALRDYSANQRKLDEIEQRLSSGAYPQ